ncbi:MAG TPA: glycosyltransferase family 39 protein [Xanthobacteraceae bacterium]|nr:glycosyltransferase family 39 protein [Xanthobacteraceae bacterium]
MFYVPLYVELLRSRPMLVFWPAVLLQAAIWIAVPMLFYSAPPEGLAQLLAVGHEFRFDAGVGPPLAYWLAEIAFRAGGLFGVYALAQVCVVATYWCVFALGRAIVGPTHAVMAVLLMVGISLFTVPSPDFGPPIVAMALWAAVLLHYWRAVIQGARRSWYALGVAAALLLLSSDAALLLLGALIVFTTVTDRGRAAGNVIEAWIVALALLPFLFLHLVWLAGMLPAASDNALIATLASLRDAVLARANTILWLRLLAVLILAHAGLAILLVLGAGWPRVRANPSPPLARAPVDTFALTYVKVFAILPGLLATSGAIVLGRSLPIGGAAPLVVLSGLALIIAAGDSIALYHQRILGFAWAGLLIVPAMFVPILIVALPWAAGMDLKVAQPAAAMGRFFADSFERRTGQPLAIVTGDPRLAALVGLAAPSRPSVFDDANPARSPWVTADDIRNKGAVVVWLAHDTTPAPPPDIKAYFPDLVAEVPRAFSRPVEGRLPTLWIGWGVIRPGSVKAAAR